ncbi:hypothetical protein MKZ02_13030 [Pseudobacillus sp. FSL P4-0506]|uniref:hypothetical protein n=1 Tax=unclassified Pseudobacillus TaxID=2619284 RepID=UPI0030F985FC
MNNVKIKLIGVLLFAFVLLLTGCAENTAEPSPTFEAKGKLLYGEKGKFGMVKLNGESGEPEFTVEKGGHYQLYFLDDSTGINGEGYSMTATHEETGKKIQLYKAMIENEQSGAKLAFDQRGLWDISVAVDKEPYASFIVEVE